MAEFIEFTKDLLQTNEGIAELNRILQTIGVNIAGDTESVRVYQGYGSPESTITAGIGSMYLRLDGGVDSTIYRKESGTGNTGWIATSSSFIPSGTIHQGDILYDNGTAWTRLVPGTSGQALITQGASSNPKWDSISKMSVFTSSGTWTAPAGITKALLTMIGGGGGGGGGGYGFAGGGGGAGQFLCGYQLTVTPGSAYTVTIGSAASGGAGGVPDGTDGSTGATTVFGSVNALGGAGGAKGTNAADGAAGATGGAYGVLPFSVATAGATPTGGNGAATNYAAAAGHGAAGTANCGNGGGGGNGTTGAQEAGGNGGTGLVIVQW